MEAAWNVGAGLKGGVLRTGTRRMKEISWAKGAETEMKRDWMIFSNEIGAGVKRGAFVWPVEQGELGQTKCKYRRIKFESGVESSEES